MNRALRRVTLAVDAPPATEEERAQEKVIISAVARVASARIAGDLQQLEIKGEDIEGVYVMLRDQMLGWAKTRGVSEGVALQLFCYLGLDMLQYLLEDAPGAEETEQ